MEKWAPYRAAFEGITSLCDQHRWKLLNSHDAGERIVDWLSSADAFVALRFDHMSGSLTSTWRMQHAVGKTLSGLDRDVFVLKLEPTTEMDEFWLGKPGAMEVLGDVQLLLELVARLVR